MSKQCTTSLSSLTGSPFQKRPTSSRSVPSCQPDGSAAAELRTPDVRVWSAGSGVDKRAEHSPGTELLLEHRAAEPRATYDRRAVLGGGDFPSGQREAAIELDCQDGQKSIDLKPKMCRTMSFRCCCVGA